MRQIQSLLRLVRYAAPSRRPAAPPLVIFHITTRCNMACRHCGDDVWGDPARDLTFPEIERFSSELGQIEAVSLGGGEPFLRGDLVEICALLYRANGPRLISIPSNGFATGTIVTRVREILERCPEASLNMMLSLDGFRETHDQMRTPGSFDRVLETGRCLAALKEREPRLSLCFNATISSRNCEELPELARFVRERFGSVLECNVLTGNPRDEGCRVPPPEQLARTMDAIYAVRDAGPLAAQRHAIYRDVVLRTNREQRQVVPCRAGSLVCMIDANGDVRACPLFPPLGNLRQSSFREIWNSRQADELYRSIRKGACSCNNDCFIRISLSHHWKLPLLLLRRLWGCR